ncbi:uncharacterized protein BP5553_07943 [Venustampulla echinocandica]|uniref:AB hydrolase-1 domain-containing protein n=1 Tax=Venustampulla echinocandica TaxID=2656787 RepID=A0A370TFA1_9HELO|nr:uncharacterized protein BP5553_07943 [Venustampulla echinocandica]RDL33575.1 hypothetical protein BP5553_07943 [Venustampulla echinocandica]
MIGTSRLEYGFIRLCIIGLHYLVPIALLYCALNVALYGFEAATYRAPLIIESMALAEALFFICAYLPYRAYLQREAVHPPAPAPAERKELFRLCNENIPDPEAFLNKWFLGADPADIRRENLKDFFLWAFFNRGGPPGDDDEELEEMVSATEKLLGRPLEPGRGNAKCLRLTLDRVDMLHRSLLWYMCVGFVDFLTCAKLYFHGFRFHRTSLSRFFTLFPFRWQTLLTTHRSPAKHTTYWHRPHTSTTKLPVVFIHGIGIGLYPYTNFLDELNSSAGVESADPDEQVGIIAIEIMPVSFRVTHHALSRQEMCAEIDQILLKHFSPDQKFVLVSHSYGTVISTHLLKTPSIAKRIGPIMLIDPVSILLHLPDVAYNFTRRKPRRANEHQLYYFASMDMGVSHTLSRHFFWNENVLWKEDLKGRKMTASLGGRDIIVDAKAVGRYLNNVPKSTPNSYRDNALNPVDAEDQPDVEQPVSILGGGGGVETTQDSLLDEEWKSRPWRGSGIEGLWSEDLDHAQIFDTRASRRRLIDVIRVYCKAE